MRHPIALILIAALALTACGGDDAASTDVIDDEVEEVEEVEDAGTEGEEDDVILDADGEEITDAEIEAALEEAILEVSCENLNGFAAAFNEFQSAEEGSQEEADAVATMDQLGEEISILIGEELPELVQALALFTVAAEQYLAGDGASLEAEEGQAAADTILSAQEACTELGL